MSYNYVAQSDIEAYLGISLTDNGVSLFNLLQPSLQQAVDTYCNRTWNFSNPITDKFDAVQDTTIPSISYIFIASQPPILDGTYSVTVSDTLLDSQYVYNYGTYVKLWIRPQTIAMTNPLGYLSVVLSYNSGSQQAVPADVKLALVQWMARMIQTAPDAGRDLVKTQFSNVQTQFVLEKNTDMPDFVKAVLDKYRLEPIDRF